MKKFDIYFDNDANQLKLISPGKINASFLGKDNEHQKCLPFKVVGELGWDLLLPNSYTLIWNGGDSPRDITITSEDKSDFISKGLGHGIISFKIPYLFELEENTFLWIKGSNNNPLSLDLYACEGLVEADWFPSHITMNYKIVTANKEIVLEKETPYCRLIPYPKKYIESFEPEYKSSKDNKSFAKKYMTYNYFNRFMPFAKQYLTSYMRGMLGNQKMDNIPKIKLSVPKIAATGSTSKCPFSKIF